MAPRCLIVDDNPEFLEAARDLLQADGIEVVGLACTEEEAIARATDLCPDVALVDVYLGGESGFALAGRLTDGSIPRPPVVILISTYSEGDLRDVLSSSPAFGFLSKVNLSGGSVRAMMGKRAQA